MARSIGCGTTRVHQRLKPGRAITLCWTPNSAISARSTASAAGVFPAAPESIDVGTNRPVSHPIR